MHSADQVNVQASVAREMEMTNVLFFADVSPADVTDDRVFM